MKRNILFVVDERMMGGVSIVLEDILKNISLKDKNVDLLILHDRGDKLKDIPKEINIIYGSKFFDVIDIAPKELLSKKNILGFIKKMYLSFLMKTGLIKNKIRKERKKILTKEYDVEIAFKYGFTSLFVIYGNSHKKINWLHCDCELNDPGKNYRKLFRKILPLFDSNVILCNSLKESFVNIYHCDNIDVINNIIDSDKVNNGIKGVQKNNKGILFVSVGRYSSQKAYERLIEAFKMLKDDDLLNDVHLDLYGSGPMEDELKNLVTTYQLENTVKINGAVNNPYKYMHQANMFILSSRDEGYPLVIIESLLSKTPVLSTDIKSAKEMLTTKTGIITDNSTEGLYKALKKILLDRKQIDVLANNLKNYTYDNSRIINQIERLLKDDTQDKKREKV